MLLLDLSVTQNSPVMLSNTSFWSHLRFRLEGWEKYLFPYLAGQNVQCVLTAVGVISKGKDHELTLLSSYAGLPLFWMTWKWKSLPRNAIISLSPEGQFHHGWGLGTSPHHLQAQWLLSVTELLLPASEHPLGSRTKVQCPLIRIQEISITNATLCQSTSATEVSMKQL